MERIRCKIYKFFCNHINLGIITVVFIIPILVLMLTFAFMYGIIMPIYYVFELLFN